jgi:hypothetical protein
LLFAIWRLLPSALERDGAPDELPSRFGFRLRMISSQNRYTPRIKCGAGFFRIMR